MKIEEGTILSIEEDGLAEVKVGRHSDCMACGACPGAEHIVVKALNPIGAEVGQHVKFEVREVNIVIGAFVCFIMPLIVAGLGAVAVTGWAFPKAWMPCRLRLSAVSSGFLSALSASSCLTGP